MKYRKIKIELSERAISYLKAMTQTGLFGVNVEETAQRIVEERLFNDIIRIRTIEIGKK